MHGPHCSAVSSDRYLTTRAVSASPHEDSGRTITMPAPSAPPAVRSAACVIGTGQATSAGSQAPK